MNLQPKNLENSKNIIDLKASRNANELMLVLGRIHTALSLREKAFSKRNSLSSLYDTIAWILQTKAELQCADGVSRSLTDIKRERCRQMIDNLMKSLRALSVQVITLSNSKCEDTVTEQTDTLVHTAIEFLSKWSNDIKRYVAYDEGTVYYTLIAKNLINADGFVSQAVHVKFRELNGSISVCFPTSPFIDSDYVEVKNGKRLIEIFKNVLTIYGRAPKVDKKRVINLSSVTDVKVVDKSLVISLMSDVTPIQINEVIKKVLPMVRSTYEVDDYEIIHSYNRETNELTFNLVNRKVAGKGDFDSLVKFLGLSKSCIKKLR